MRLSLFAFAVLFVACPRSTLETGTVSTIAHLSDAPRAIALDERGPRPRLWVLVTDALLLAEPP